MGMIPIRLVDEDGDHITIRPVGGFGEPMLAFVTVQDADESGVNVTVPQAKRMIQWLQEWVESVETNKGK